MAELGARLEQQRVAADNTLALLTASGGVDATAAAQAYFTPPLPPVQSGHAASLPPY